MSQPVVFGDDAMIPPCGNGVTAHELRQYAMACDGQALMWEAEAAQWDGSREGYDVTRRAIAAEWRGHADWWRKRADQWDAADAHNARHAAA